VSIHRKRQFALLRRARATLKWEAQMEIKRIQKFVSSDGTEFTTEEACREYERLRQAVFILVQRALGAIEEAKRAEKPYLLTIEEAAREFGVNVHTLRAKVRKREGGFVVMWGSRPMIHREKFKKYLDSLIVGDEIFRIKKGGRI
jgi:excisionase family DNA binding protein